MSAFKLQNFLKKLSDVDLVIYTDVVNFQLNGKWVTDINRNYYEVIGSGILKILQENSNKDEVSEVKTALLDAKQKTLKKWQDLIVGSNENHTPIEHYSKVKPRYSTLDFLDEKEQEERKRFVFDTVIDLWNIDLGSFIEIDLHAYLLSPEANKSEKDIKFYYCYGHISYVFSIRVDIIDNLLIDVEKLNETDNLSYMEETSINPYSIEFNLKKMDIAFFFKILYEEGIIKTEGKNRRTQETHLKNYIDNANIFYLDDKKRVQVKKINKQFAEISPGGLDAKTKDEIIFLEDFIAKLQNRLNKLEEETLEKKIK